jgi:peptidoglycan/xylan/chitin deacetylase (PgdA/CDA1 family)
MDMRRVRVGTISILVAGLLLADVTAAAAATRPVRLEPGRQTGYTFSSSGAIVSSRTITVTTSPLATTTDRRRVVAGRTGIYIRITSGSLKGYEVRESPVAYLPGLAGDTAYSPAVTIGLGAGTYLGYRFDADWDLDSTKVATVSTATTATSTRRAVVDGRPYVWITTGPLAGTWLPVTVSRGTTAQRLTCSVPHTAAAGTSQVLRRISTTESKVALTFDMGGRLTPALDIIERLVIDRVCATIHLTGQAAQTTTGTAVMAIIKAHPELFETGNHTMWHCNLRDGGTGIHCPATPPSDERIRTELREAEAIITAGTGRSPTPYWRPPYGAYDTHVRDVAASVGYTKTLMWDVDTIDWKKIADGGPTTAAMAAKVVTNARTGSIVLMHLGGYHTYDALPSMVMGLRAAGLQPTSISDLLS